MLPWLLVLVLGALAVVAFVAFVALFCSTNAKVEQREMRVGSRFAEQCLTVADWRERPEAESLRGSDIRCWTPITRRGAA